MMVLFMGLSLNSCNKESQAQNIQQLTEKNILKDDAPSTENDSLKTSQVAHETTSKDINSKANKDKDDKVPASKIKGKEICFWGAILLVCIISLILFVICIKLYSNLKYIVDRHNFDIEKLKKLNQEVAIAPKTVERTCVPSDYESLKQRIYSLELQIKQLMSCKIKEPQPVSATGSVGIEPTMSKIGYFGNPTSAAEPYFKKLFVSLDSEARFSVEISGDKAIFKPIESSGYIGTFISNDAMRAAIEFQGCPPGERPSSMRVIMPGEAVHRDNRWFITKKAQVHLS